MYQLVLFNFTHCPLVTQRFYKNKVVWRIDHANLKNRKYWGFFLKDRWNVFKNIFIVNKNYAAQKDGVRRLKTVLFGEEGPQYRQQGLEICQ